MVIATAGVAGATPVLGPVVEVHAPVDAASAPVTTLAGVACWSGSVCTSVGGYENTSSNGVPMAASGSSSGWARAVPVSLPANHVASFGSSGLDAVACPGPTTCVAVGSYEDTTPEVLPIVATESSSKWATATTVKLPAAAGGNQLSQLTSIACSAVGSCVAVGSFSDKKSSPAIMVVIEVGDVWGAATQLSLPPDAGTVQHALGNIELAGVSCENASNCVAVGSYLDRAGSIVPMHVTETAGTWGVAVRAKLPAHLPAVESAELDSVSCVSIGSCVAVGYFTNASSRIAPVIETESAGTWGPIVPVGIPAMVPAATGGVLADVACAIGPDCTAVGDITLASGQTVPDVAVDVAGHWQPLARLTTIPAGIAHPRTAELHSVACPGSNLCVAVGSVFAISARGLVTNGEAMATRVVPVRPIVDPAPPTGVVALPRNGALAVTWHPGDDGGSPITSFTATAEPGTKHCVASSAGCTITGLTNGTRYSVVVTATSAHGSSVPSGPSAGAVPGTLPTAPTAVTFAVAHDHAVVRWHRSTGSAGDPVARYVVLATSPIVPTRSCASAAPACTLVGLAPGRVYTVTVVAQSAVGTSARSSPRQFRAA